VLTRLELVAGTGGVRTARPPAGSRLGPLRLHRGAADEAGGNVAGGTEQEEAALLVLGGTFDLRAATNAWGSRGFRADPFSGRPVAVFLPPRCAWSGTGTGEILVLGALPPPPRPVTGREALAQKPLLPLAGSGKAFDPTSGQWKTHEEFPSAPQAVLPRHIERVQVGAVAVERVFPVAYKALGLCVDELVVPDGAVFRLAELAGRPAATEVMVYVRVRGAAELRCDGSAQVVEGEAAFAVELRGATADLAVTARGGPCYVALGWAGK
jgi:hypothetical protein